jgi:tetratricopeptide (TPR) repeat protein
MIRAVNTRRLPFLLVPALGGLAVALAQTPDDRVLQMLHHPDEVATRTSERTNPKLDPKRIINDSNSLLKEREPEMTAEEYALYEKIALMLGSQPEFAIKLLEAMMNDKETPSPAFEFMLGNAYYAAGQTAKAETRFLSAVKRFPSFIRAWNNLGVLYYTADKYTEATPCFSKAVTLGDHDPVTLGLLGYCLERSGNIVAAEMAYMQALSGNPDNTDWMEGLLRVYIQGKQYGRGESLVRSLIKLKPAEVRYWLGYASILLAQNRKLEAIVMLEVSVGAGIAGPNELNQLGDLYAEQGFAAEAAGIYQKILAATPDLGEQKLLHFAQGLIQLGKLAQAEDVLGRLQTGLTPAGHLVYLQARGDLFAARKQWPQARQQLQELLQAEPLNGPALLGLGRTYTAEGDLIHAGFAFESAAEIPVSKYQANLELANLELKDRHYDKCVEHLQKALSIERTDAVEDFLARVKTLVVKSE